MIVFELVAERDEVDHVLVLVERASDLDRDAVIVAVQPLADIAVERDEVRGAEDVMFFFEADAVGHEGSRRFEGQG